MRKPSSVFFALTAVAWPLIAGTAGCDTERKAECTKFLGAMAPMQAGAVPPVDTVDEVHDGVVAISFQDVPLQTFASNYAATLAVLSSTLKLRDGAGPDGPPDGTNDVIKTKVKEARTDFDDITRYCTP